MISAAGFVLVVQLLGAASHELTAKLAGPSQVEIMNNSSKSYLYRQHWAWAPNRMWIEAKGPDGVVTRSEPLLFDIDTRAACFYTKPLGSHERFAFEVPVNRSPMTTLQLRFPRSGRYELAWVYEFTAESSEAGHKCFDVPFWEGKLRSNTVTVKVVK